MSRPTKNGTASRLCCHLKTRVNKDVHERITAPFWTEWFGLPAAMRPDETCRSVTALGKPCTVVFANGSMTEFRITFFALWAWKMNWKNYPYTLLSLRGISTARVQKRAFPMKSDTQPRRCYRQDPCGSRRLRLSCVLHNQRETAQWHQLRDSSAGARQNERKLNARRPRLRQQQAHPATETSFSVTAIGGSSPIR